MKSELKNNRGVINRLNLRYNRVINLKNKLIPREQLCLNKRFKDFNKAEKDYFDYEKSEIDSNFYYQTLERKRKILVNSERLLNKCRQKLELLKEELKLLEKSYDKDSYISDDYVETMKSKFNRHNQFPKSLL